MSNRFYVFVMVFTAGLGAYFVVNRATERFGLSRADFENDEQFHERLLSIAAEYESFGRLDEQIRHAPTGCSGVLHIPRASEAAWSRSELTDSHGRKLYFLFVKRQGEYAYASRFDDTSQPVGQVIVKQAWEGVPVSNDQEPTSVGPPDDPKSYVPFAHDPSTGQLYRTGEQRELFIMYKLDPNTPGTDQGWVYGTVTPDGKRVTSAGVVSHCANCHQGALYDRMLGLREWTGL